MLFKGLIKVVPNRDIFHKLIIPLACILGLLFALAPKTAPASGGASREWDVALSAGRIQDGSATVADIDGDGKDEIIIGTTNQPTGATTALVVLEDDGTIKWSKALEDGIGSAPTVADISSPPDGIPEILVTTGVNIPEFARAGSIVAFDRDGNQLWDYKTADPNGTNTPHGNFASPVVGDLDNDGDVEIVLSSWDRNIYLLDHLGNYVWHYIVADTVWSTPVLVDLDGNQTLEIVVGTDIKGGGVLPDGYMPTDGGFILILDKDGKKLARRQMNESIYSSPAVADVDGDGDFEIFIGSGVFYYELGSYTQVQVYGFSVDMSGPADQYGSVWEVVDLPGWPKVVAYPGIGSPALADLDNNGDLEVIIGTGNLGGGSTECSNSESDSNCTGALYAWHHTGESVSGFPMWPKEGNGKNWPIRSSPTVGDVDGDNQLEITISTGWEIAIVGSNGVQEAALHTDYTILASPAIADIDGDGQTNIIIGGSSVFDSDHGRVYNFEYGSGSFNQTMQPWPQFHRDAQNSGLVPAPGQIVPASSPLSLFHKIGSGNSTSGALTLNNPGGSAVNFSASADSNAISLSETSGQIAANGSMNLTVTVDTSDLSEGTHPVGNINISDTDTNTQVATVPVNVTVGNLTFLYLPVVIR